MIIQLNEDLTHKQYNLKKRNTDCICEDSKEIDLLYFINAEFHTCKNLEEFRQKFINTIIFSCIFIQNDYDSLSLDPYSFKNLLKNLIKIYINYDNIEFIDVEYHPLNNCVMSKYFAHSINLDNVSDCYHQFIDKDGTVLKMNYTTAIHINNSNYINYGCYIIIFRDTETDIKKRYIISYRLPLDHNNYNIIVPLIKKLNETDYNKIQENILKDDYYPELYITDIHNFYSKFEFN